MHICARLALLAVCILASAPFSVHAQTPPSAAVPGPSYQIGPGDTLQVFVWQNPELSMTVPVRPDGKISTPLVSDMVAVGKTPAALAADIQASLGEYIRSPQVSVIVSNPVGTLSQVKLIGQVKTPSGIPYRDGLRILDAILQVGGITQFAAPNRTKLIRTEGGRQTERRIKVGKLLDGGDLKQNILLQPGDVIVVPEALF